MKNDVAIWLWSTVAVMAALKLFGVITFSWWIVFAPVLLPLMLLVAGMTLTGIGILMMAIVETFINFFRR
mgnify:CR=1 FL=1